MINALDTQEHQEDVSEKHYSVFFHLFFGVIILGLLGILCLIFKDVLFKIMDSFPIFSSNFLICMGWGFLYYIYKIIQFRNFIPTQEKLLAIKHTYLDKKIDLFHLMQIIIGIVGIATIINSIFSMINISKNSPAFDNYDMLVQPLYIILICLIGISVLLILSLRINEIIFYVYNHNPVILKNSTQIIASPYGGFMSDNTPQIQENPVVDSTLDSVTLPVYDNGFLYKKLFELNDNIQNIQKHIIIGNNDNTNNNAVQTLWDTKIYPFLNSLCDRIKTLETKLEAKFDLQKTQALNTPNIITDSNQDFIQKISDNLDITQNLSVNPMNEDIILQDKKISDKIIAETASAITPTYIEDDFVKPNTPSANIETISVKEIISDTGQQAPIAQTVKTPINDSLQDDDEETFIHITTKQEPIKHDAYDTQINAKDKTLDELSKFLEDKMKELYDNNFSKNRLLNT